MRLQCEVHRDDGVFERLRDEWNQLDELTQPRRPYTSHLWNLLWWKHFRRSSVLVSDRLFLITVRDGSQNLIAVAPMMMTSRPASGRFAMRKLQFFGSDRRVCETRGIICRHDDRCSATSAIIAFIEGMDREWDLLRWEGGDECATAVDLFGEGAKVLSTYAFKEYVVRLPTNWQTMNATLSQNMRRKVRTVYALLEKAALPWRMDVVCDKARLEDEMHHFIDLYFKRAETTDAHVTARTNKLQHAAVRAFVLDFVYGMARTGGALLFYLTVDGKRVASQLAYRLGDELYLSYSAFDPAWAAFSAMTTLTIEIFKWSFAQGLRLVNLSTGTDLGKLRWRPTENDLHIATVYSGSLRAATLSVAYNVIRKANSHASGTTVEK